MNSHLLLEKAYIYPLPKDPTPPTGCTFDMDALSQRLVNIDAIFLDPGINVRSAGGKVMTGHKYTDPTGSHYIELWRRPSVPRLLV